MASSLIGGLFSGGGSENAQNNANNQNTGGDGGDGGDGGSKGKGGLPLPLIIGGVLVVGGIIFLVMRGKGKKKK